MNFIPVKRRGVPRGCWSTFFDANRGQTATIQAYKQVCFPILPSTPLSPLTTLWKFSIATAGSP
jgi:hypothetical protein